MLRVYRSIDEAWQAFAVYARREPRLWPLWDLCRRAAPPVRETAFVDDVYADDPLENDLLATDKPDDGWCAEDYFLRHVKSKLLLLVGMYGPGEVHELYSREAYETIYDLLINWALNRSCVCCAEHDDDDDDAPRHRGGVGSPAYQ
jgi:hypothetical protein